MKIDGLEVQVVRKPIKNMYLRIKPPNGVVMISAPRRMAEQTIIDFVRDRRPWIDNHRRRMALARERSVIGSLGDSWQRGAGHGGVGLASGGFDGVNNGSSVATDNAALTWTKELRERASANINAQLPALLAKWGPIVGRTPTHTHVAGDDFSLRVMHASYRPSSPEPSVGPYGAAIPGICAGARNDPFVGKRSRYRIPAAHDYVSAELEGVAPRSQSSCGAVEGYSE